MKNNKIFADVLSQLDPYEFYSEYGLDLSKSGNFNCPFPDPGLPIVLIVLPLIGLIM